MIALVRGGSGSGKSDFAERLAAHLPGTEHVYLATMAASRDEETQRRIARHRQQRQGRGFRTVEQPRSVRAAGVDKGACVLLECLPNLAANEMFGGGEPDRMTWDVLALADKCAHLVVVTDVICSDGVAYDEGTLKYMALLSSCEACLAQRADLVAEVICGIPVALKGEIPCGL